MCKYCETDGYHRTELIEAECIDIRVVGNKLNLDYAAYSCDSSFEEDVKINFCPMCGQKLVELVNEEDEEDDEEDED
ncbi:hypothetical protein [Bacillus phage PK16]|nr:hypothetical protein [Bacillus phage PK16]AUM58973.1 hypothetical protein BCP01_172 [Bacillus phage BCP01]